MAGFARAGPGASRAVPTGDKGAGVEPAAGEPDAKSALRPARPRLPRPPRRREIRPLPQTQRPRQATPQLQVLSKLCYVAFDFWPARNAPAGYKAGYRPKSGAFFERKR